MNAIRFSDGVGILSFAIFIYLTIETYRQYRPCLGALRKKLTQGEGVSLGSCEPRVQVLLCLRGRDPFLDRCLNGLANQNYSAYRVTFILDSAEDEAYGQVEELVATLDSDQFNIIVRDRLFSTCSRRACSLLTGLDRVDDDVDVVVMCDGDVDPHSNWLRELIAGLNDPTILATSANRWYAPATPNLGSLTRFYWNAMAVPAMYDHGIPWAGSMAISRTLFTDPEFLKCIQHAFSEDTQLASYLNSKGIPVKPMPELPIVNEETISISSFWGFLARQLIAARLHHPNWSRVLFQAGAFGVVVWVLLPLSMFAGPHAIMGWVAGFATCSLVVQSIVGIHDWQIRRLVRTSREMLPPPYGWRRILLSAPAGALVMFFYPVAVLHAVFLKKHVWRGVSYHINKGGIIALDAPTYEVQPIQEYESVS